MATTITEYLQTCVDCYLIVISYSFCVCLAVWLINFLTTTIIRAVTTGEFRLED